MSKHTAPLQGRLSGVKNRTHPFKGYITYSTAASLKQAAGLISFYITQTKTANTPYNYSACTNCV